jgi:adenylate kinase
MAVCPVCGGALYRRNDDEDTQAIATRLESFHRDTQPCIDWLEEKGLLVHIDGMQSPQKVFQEIIKVMEGKSKD